MKRAFAVNKGFFCNFQRLFKRLLTMAVLLSPALIANGTLGALTGNVPVISVGVFSSLGYTSFYSRKSQNSEYHFATSLEIPVGAANINGDLYFGIIYPSTMNTYSWVADESGKIGVAKGTAPLIERDTSWSACTDFIG